MIKLKLTAFDITAFAQFCGYTCTHIKIEIDKFVHRKKTIDLLQLKVSHEEMKIMFKQFAIRELRIVEINPKKKYSIKLSPIQCMLILMYSEDFIKHTRDEYKIMSIQQQKDIIYKELLTK